MGPADQGAGRIKETSVLFQQGTGVCLQGGAGALLDTLAVRQRQFLKRRRQGGRLHREQ
jgi:hypothetical protein